MDVRSLETPVQKYPLNHTCGGIALFFMIFIPLSYQVVPGIPIRSYDKPRKTERRAIW